MLHPGEIRSKSDGDIHFISGSQLANLYRVRRDVDRVVEYDRRNPTHDENWQLAHGEVWLHLYPSRAGEYRDIHWADDYQVIPPKK